MRFPGPAVLRFVLHAALRRLLGRWRPRWQPERRPWPVVSVIVPVDEDGGLEAAVRTVLDQAYDDVEVLVIGDTSRDTVEAAVRRLANSPRVRVFHDPVAGRREKLARALPLTRGELVAWMSTADRLAPTAIRAMVDALLREPDSLVASTGVAPGGARASPGATALPATRWLEAARRAAHEPTSAGPTWTVCRRDAAMILARDLAEDGSGLELGPIAPGRSKDAEARRGTGPPSRCTRAGSASSPPSLARHECVGASRVRAPEWSGLPDALVWDDTLSAADRLALDALAVEIGAAVGAPGVDESPARTVLRFTSGSGILGDPVYVRVRPDVWQFVWGSSDRGEEAVLDLWRGLSIDPRVGARRCAGRASRPRQAGRRRVLGCHLGLADADLDVAAVRRIIAGNPTLYFLFVDVSGRDAPELGGELVAGLQNAAYAEAAPFGEAIERYPALDVVWLPPRRAAGSRPPRVPRAVDEAGSVDAPYRMALALAYAIRRPLLAPREQRFIPAPGQYYYHSGESLAFVTTLATPAVDRGQLDGYLTSWRPVNCFRQLLRYAGRLLEIEQRRRGHRDAASRSAAPPRPWRVAARRRQALRLLLAADTLDTGGLETTLARLADRLPRLGVEAAVLCVKAGGATARQLQHRGIRVHLARGDPGRIRDVLLQERPTVVHSQLAALDLLDAAGELGLPVVETIQNAYVWFDRGRWAAEARRSRHFARATAVSALVRSYYAKWNPAFSPDWVTVIPNGVDPDAIPAVDRAQARRTLGIDDDDVVFLTLASYAPQKNQIGLLTAFDETARRHPRSRLLCAGSIADPRYHRRLADYRRALPSGRRVELHPFRDDIPVLLAAADVFVLNSFFEGWSVAATEALMAGVPVIHSECGSAHELVGPNAERGIVVPNPAADGLDVTWELVSPLLHEKRHRNTGLLVEAMSRMVEDRAAWRRRAPDIRAHAIAAFGVDACVSAYEAVFQEAAAHL